jgi:RNase P subunit RPR2
VYNWHRPESRTYKVVERPCLLDHIRIVLAAIVRGEDPGERYDTLVRRVEAYIARERRIAQIPGTAIAPQPGDAARVRRPCPDCGFHGTVVPYRASSGYLSSLYAVCVECGWNERLPEAFEVGA